MAGKKDSSVVAVISGLTTNQAAQIIKDIVRAKEKHAPFGRGTIATGVGAGVGRLLQQGQKMIGGE